jgi:hypothetical protein
MKTFCALATGTLLALVAAGCETTSRPSLSHPGTAQQQQARAVQFDPYPENIPGPNMDGIRPRDYDKPIPEVDRGRMTNPTNPWSASWLPWNWTRK